MIQWFEELPDQCPPKDAAPAEDVIFYRLCRNEDPEDQDFYSHRKLNPEAVYNVSECIARAVSLNNSRDAAVKLKKIPAFREKKITAIKLSVFDGLVCQTGPKKHHFSWWRSLAFDVTKCKIA